MELVKRFFRWLFAPVILLFKWVMSCIRSSSKSKKKAPETVQESIPYTKVYTNGVIETEPGVFTRAYRIRDVDFTMASEDEQMRIYNDYGALLNTFPSTCTFQMLIVNKRANRRTFLKNIQFKTHDDGLNPMRSAMNKIIVNNGVMAQNIDQEKICVVAITADDVNKAMHTIKTLDRDIARALKKFDQDREIRPMTMEERLRSLHGIYNQDGSSVFENTWDIRKRPIFDMEAANKQGLTTKDVIAPSAMEFKSNYFMLGNMYGRTFYLHQKPSSLSTDYIADLSELPHRLLISATYTPINRVKAAKMVKNYIVSLNAQKASANKTATQEGYSMELTSPELENKLLRSSDLMNDISNRDQNLFYLTFVVTAFAESYEELEAITQEIYTVTGEKLAPVRPLIYQQENGLNTSLPFALNLLSTKKLMTTEAGAILLPFNTVDLHQESGIYYGINRNTKSIITYNRLSGHNYNGLIFGDSGSGKSGQAKLEMLQTRLKDPNNYIYVIDPENEYTPIARKLNGEVVTLRAGGQTSFVNPMDMDLDYSGDEDPVAMKSDYLYSLMELMLGRNRSLSPTARSILDRCVQKVYSGYMAHMEELKKNGSDITCDKTAAPTLHNLYQEFKLQPEREAEDMAAILELYAVGSASIFAHRSNIDTASHMIVYDISQLGTGMKDLGLYICLNDIWNRMIQNRKKNCYTYFYIDEMHLLLKSESTAAFLVEIWKRARKWNGIPTGITQNTDDLLRSASTRAIVDNTSFIMMMGLSAKDQANLQEILKLSDAQLECVDGVERSQGLIRTDKMAIPFENRIPVDSPIFEFVNTSGQNIGK